MKRILLLATFYDELGGVGQYLRQFSRALQMLGHSVQVETMIALDRPFPKRMDRFRWMRNLAFHMDRTDYDLVIAGHITLAPTARMLGRPYVVILYGVDVWQKRSRVRHKILRWGLDKAHRLVTLSHHTAYEVVNKFNDGGLFWYTRGTPGIPHVIYPAVDPIFWQIATHDETPQPRHHPLQLLTVGRLSAAERYKGHEHVIEALPLVSERLGEKVRYMIAGDGDDLDRIAHLVVRLGLSEQVQFFGVARRNALPALYESCDVFVMPSTGEGFGIVYLEAQAFGKPCIVGTGGSREAIHVPQTGYTYDPNKDDITVLVKQIAALADDQLRIGMGRAAKEWVKEHYTQDRLVQDVDRLLKGL